MANFVRPFEWMGRRSCRFRLSWPYRGIAWSSCPVRNCRRTGNCRRRREKEGQKIVKSQAKTIPEPSQSPAGIAGVKRKAKKSVGKMDVQVCQVCMGMSLNKLVLEIHHKSHHTVTATNVSAAVEAALNQPPTWKPTPSTSKSPDSTSKSTSAYKKAHDDAV